MKLGAYPDPFWQARTRQATLAAIEYLVRDPIWFILRDIAPVGLFIAEPKGPIAPFCGYFARFVSAVRPSRTGPVAVHPASHRSTSESGHPNRGRPSPAAHATLQGMSGETRTLEDVIRELDGGLRELYGERHRGLVLYGSHARGEADEGSDVDLLLLLEGQVQVGREIRRSSDLVASLSLESSRVLSLIPVSVEDYRASSDPYLVNARREGALLSPAAG